MRPDVVNAEGVPPLQMGHRPDQVIFRAGHGFPYLWFVPQGSGVKSRDAQGRARRLEGERAVRIGAENVPCADHPVVSPGAVPVLFFQQKIHAAAECRAELSAFSRGNIRNFCNGNGILPVAGYRFRFSGGNSQGRKQKQAGKQKTEHGQEAGGVVG